MADSTDQAIQAFVCSHCGVYAAQFWSAMAVHRPKDPARKAFGSWRVSFCLHCGKQAVWNGEARIDPVGGRSPLPHADMPEALREDFEEARAIADLSPRGAASLLRLCVQKLCVELGQPGKKLDDDIAALVTKGLDERIQKALDIVRVIGNNAVHPGELDVSARPEDVTATFGLINEIIDELIAKPKRLDQLYNSLPDGALQSIEKRNARARATASVNQVAKSQNEKESI